jgi:NACHT domain
MRVSRGRRLGAVVVLAALAVGVFWLGQYLHSKGLVWAANSSSVAAAALAAVALLTPVLSRLLHTLSGPPPLSRTSIVQARDDLAVALAREWAEEERLRQINDPRPLPVAWAVTPTARAASAATANAATIDAAGGQFETILSLFAQLSPPRLIILGRAGAGKSVLVIKLARELLTARQADDIPVPVILPAAAWDLDASLPEWIAEQLCNNRPGLLHPIKDATGKVTTLALALAVDKMVLPIIDGLDELAEEQQGKAIDKINKYGSDAPLVLTSRTGEFSAAIAAAGRGVARAAVVEILPLEIQQAEQYLIEATAGAPAGRWDSVFARLNSEPGGPLARVLCTPLMLWLARTEYESAGDPAELADQTRFADVEDLEDHLLDALVPTVYAWTTSSWRSRYRPRHAERWLGFLAAHLDRISQPDFAWWRLIRATSGWRVVCIGLRTVLFCSAAWAVTNWLLTRHGHWDNGSYVSHAAWYSILMEGPLGRQAWPALDRLLTFRQQRIHSFVHSLNPHLPHYIILPWVSIPGFEITLVFLGAWLGIMGVVTNTPGANDEIAPRRLRARPYSIARAATSNAFGRAFIVAVVVGFAMILLTPAAGAFFPPNFFHQWPTWRALLAIAATGATVIPMSHLAQPLDVSRSASPANALRLDRQASWSVWAQRKVLGAATAWLWAGPEIASAYGFLAIIAMLARVVFGGTDWASDSYIEARMWLFMRGQMPWRTLRFLADAHRRGVLRQTGAVYQFRHARLQERLAATHPLMITRMSGWVRRELLERSLVRLSVSVGNDQAIAADDENARHHGWMITVGPADLRKYRDPRFDKIASLSTTDSESTSDEDGS